MNKLISSSSANNNKRGTNTFISSNNKSAHLSSNTNILTPNAPIQNSLSNFASKLFSSGFSNSSNNNNQAQTLNEPLLLNQSNDTSTSSIAQSNKSLSEISNFTCSCSSFEPNLTLYFRVKFYVNEFLILRDQQTRYLYYLQLRQNYLSINHKMNEEKYFLLASLAMVADYGPFNSSAHINKYFDLNYYFPNWV